jgi:hypothetical protein
MWKVFGVNYFFPFASVHRICYREGASPHEMLPVQIRHERGQEAEAIELGKQARIGRIRGDAVRVSNTGVTRKTS